MVRTVAAVVLVVVVLCCFMCSNVLVFGDVGFRRNGLWKVKEDIVDCLEGKKRHECGRESGETQREDQVWRKCSVGRKSCLFDAFINNDHMFLVLKKLSPS